MNELSAASAVGSGGFVCSLPSRLELVDGVCASARSLLEQRGLSHLIFPVDLLLREFVVNAMDHGNGLDAGKSVVVEIRIGPKWVVLRILDEGPGFRWRTVSRTPPEEQSTSGRGLAIGALYAERMRYNNAGNQITLWISKSTRKEGQGL